MLSYSERNELFNNNIDLAYKFAMDHWASSKLDINDVKQEALLALWGATETYDSSKASFSTYAVACIKSRLSGFGMYELYGRVGRSPHLNRAMSCIDESNTTNQDAIKIADDNGYSLATKEYINLLLNKSFVPLSLDGLRVADANESEYSLAEFIPDSYNLEDAACNHIWDELILNFFDTEFAKDSINAKLEERTRRLKLMKYFKESIFGIPTRLAVIAQEVGMTRSAVSAQFQRWQNKLERLLKMKRLAMLIDNDTNQRH